MSREQWIGSAVNFGGSVLAVLVALYIAKNVPALKLNE